MNKIIKEILTLPGVIGTCVFNQDQTLLLSELPESFTQAMAGDITSNVGRIAQMAKVKGMEPQTIAVNYDKFIVLILAIEDDNLFIVLCKPSCNTSLVTTTAYMLAPELIKTLDQDNYPVAPPESVPKQAKPEINPKTSQALDFIKQSLFETIGPIAEMVYDDCLERWTESNPADLSRIFELIGCISTEIDDPDMFNEFKGKIASLL